jgi:hypothetical protein
LVNSINSIMKIIVNVVVFSFFCFSLSSQTNDDLIHLDNTEIIKCNITEVTADSIYYTIGKSELSSISLNKVYDFYYDFNDFRASQYFKKGSKRARTSFVLGGMAVAAGGLVILLPEGVVLFVFVSTVSAVMAIIYRISAWNQIAIAGNIMEVIEDAIGQGIRLYN